MCVRTCGVREFTPSEIIPYGEPYVSVWIIPYGETICSMYIKRFVGVSKIVCTTKRRRRKDHRGDKNEIYIIPDVFTGTLCEPPETEETVMKLTKCL